MSVKDPVDMAEAEEPILRLHSRSLNSVRDQSPSTVHHSMGLRS